VKIGATKPGITSNSPTRIRNNKLAYEPLSLSRRGRNRLGFFPPFLKPDPGEKDIANPVNDSSNSCKGIVRGPNAGSLMYAFFLFRPDNTTKWLKFQNTIIGRDKFFNPSISLILYPLASRLYSLAAFTMFIALLPSLDTPHFSRSSSRGTYLP